MNLYGVLAVTCGLISVALIYSLMEDLTKRRVKKLEEELRKLKSQIK